MEPFDLTDVARQALVTTLVVTSPVLVVALVVGILTGFLQAVTQIHDQALSFIPKLFAVLICAAVFGPWIMEYVADYATTVFSAPSMF
ncbi:MAG: flagellar biosynthetic protein FliQ [Planctomycetales bacterium]|nr:flagellar biosynthetic protein FliQ [Planctomycetales bacterium]